MIAQLRQIDHAHDLTHGDQRSDNEKTVWRTRSALLMSTISGLLNTSKADKSDAMLAEEERRRAIVTDAQANIEQLIADQPDWRTMRDARARDREWARQQALIASRKALIEGVEYISGIPAVPQPLHAILGTTVEHDNRIVCNWFGGLRERANDGARLSLAV